MSSVLAFFPTFFFSFQTFFTQAYLFFGDFQLAFLYRMCTISIPSSPSHAPVPTKQSRPEHGTRILPFEIGRKILLARTKNLLLFLHSGSNTELLLLQISSSRRLDRLCSLSLSVLLRLSLTLSQNSTRSRRPLAHTTFC